MIMSFSEVRKKAEKNRFAEMGFGFKQMRNELSISICTDLMSLITQDYYEELRTYRFVIQVIRSMVV